MNKKTLGISFAVVIALGLGVGGYYFFSKQSALNEKTAKISEDQTSYRIAISSVYSTEKRDDVILDLEGQLLVHEQDAGQHISEWDSISKLIVTNNAVAPDNILHFATLSTLEDGAQVHFLDNDFPSSYAGFQKEFLTRFFVPVALKAGPEIYHSEREAKNVFKVKYLVSESKGGFEVTRNWIQNIQGDIAIDAKANGFRYEYDASGKLLSMNGTLTFMGIDHENLAFRLITKISVNAGETVKLSAARRIYRNRNEMVLAQAEKPARDPNEKLRPLSEVFAALDQLSGTDEPQVRADLYLEMAKILADNPAVIKEFKDKILSMDGVSKQSQYQMSVIFSVLSGSETNEGSNVLADLFAGDCKNEHCREMAISAYGMHSNVSLDSAQKVLHIAETEVEPDMAANAYLGAGAAGRLLGDRFAELRPSLLNAVKSAEEEKDYTKKALVVRAIGNTGDRAFLPVLSENIKSEDELTKNMSYFALRFIPGDDVNDIIVNSLQNEKDELTTAEIIRSASMRTFSKNEYDKIGEKIPEWGESDADLAVNTVNILLAAYQRNPEDTASTLETLKSKVKSTELRSYIEAGMNPLGPTPNDEGNKDPDDAAGSNSSNAEPDEE